MNDLGALDDYLFGYLPEDEAAAFEESLFDAAADGRCPDGVFLDGVGMWGRFVKARSGGSEVPTRAAVDALVARGFKVEMAEASPDAPYVSGWSDDTEIAVIRFALDMRGHDGRFDVDIELPGGLLVKTFRDVSYDPNDGAFYAICEAPLARAASELHCFWKLYESQGDGRELVGTVEQIPREHPASAG